MIFEEKTLSSERIYEGTILNLRRDKVTVRNGTSYREIVEHSGGAVAAAINDEGKIVLVKQFRKPVDCVVLEAPAGKIEKGEDPAETIYRELKEETGYTADSMEFMTAIKTSVGYTDETLYIYLARGLMPGETNFDENEAIEVVEYDFEEAYSMVLGGEIRDAKTVVAILMAKNHLQNQ